MPSSPLAAARATARHPPPRLHRCRPSSLVPKPPKPLSTTGSSPSPPSAHLPPNAAAAMNAASRSEILPSSSSSLSISPSLAMESSPLPVMLAGHPLTPPLLPLLPQAHCIIGHRRSSSHCPSSCHHCRLPLPSFLMAGSPSAASQAPPLCHHLPPWQPAIQAYSSLPPSHRRLPLPFFAIQPPTIVAKPTARAAPLLPCFCPAPATSYHATIASLSLERRLEKSPLLSPEATATVPKIVGSHVPFTHPPIRAPSPSPNPPPTGPPLLLPSSPPISLSSPSVGRCHPRNQQPRRPPWLPPSKAISSISAIFFHPLSFPS